MNFTTLYLINYRYLFIWIQSEIYILILYWQSINLLNVWNAPSFSVEDLMNVWNTPSLFVEHWLNVGNDRLYSEHQFAECLKCSLVLRRGFDVCLKWLVLRRGFSIRCVILVYIPYRQSINFNSFKGIFSIDRRYDECSKCSLVLLGGFAECLKRWTGWPEAEPLARTGKTTALSRL